VCDSAQEHAVCHQSVPTLPQGAARSCRCSLPLSALYLTQALPDRLAYLCVPQYRNANMKGLKHASYLRLMALKDLMWSVEAVLQVGSGRAPALAPRMRMAALDAACLLACTYAVWLAGGRGLVCKGAVLTRVHSAEPAERAGWHVSGPTVRAGHSA
jgi:hypothetical protein